MLSEENDVSIEDIQTSTEDAVATTPPPRKGGRRKKDETVESTPEQKAEATAPAPTSAPAGASVVEQVASMSDTDKQALLDALGVSEAVRVATGEQQPRREISLAIRVGVWPVDGDATKQMTATKAAQIMGVEVADIMGYSVRAPRNVDGEPISEQAHLIVSLTDSSKKAVPLAG